MSDCHSKIIHLIKRNLKLSNTNKLTSRLKQETWNNVYKCKDTNEAYNAFLSTFLEYFNETCPKEIITTKSKAIANPWMDKSLLKCSKKKKKLYNKFLKNRNNDNEKNYKNYKFFYQDLIKNAKKKYYSNQINKCKFDSKKTWSIINLIMGREKLNSPSLPKRIVIENNDIFCQKLISEEFNKYFTNIGPNLVNKIVPTSVSFKTYLKTTNNVTMLDYELGYEELEAAFASLKKKKAPGFDEISSDIVIANKHSLNRPLIHILKLSLNSGIFPDVLKLAKVIPLYKCNDHSDISNYRPISILSVFSKLFERVVYNRIYDYFIKNNFFYPNQFGFQKKSLYRTCNH
ncbi:uncharacterized protein LOC136086417 [Hydra vulgaris]|uniref:Uncharacterized protein LOC136086417 n=1 Tax=Hydra vulgaris TaxID=6087 RepID=A0ABM4CSB8_HYDVU